MPPGAGQATGIPKVATPRIRQESASADVGDLRSRRACNTRVRVLPAEAALCMNAIGPATQVAHCAVDIPVVWHCWLRAEMATRGRTEDAGIAAFAAEAALDVGAISETTQ